MKTRIQLVSLIICCMLAGGTAFGQKGNQQCAAAFLDTRMIVNEYSPKGQCRIALQASGELTVQTVELSATESKALQAIPFQLAIRDGQTRTLTLYAPTEFVKVPVHEVLKKCRKGDSLVLLTPNDAYSLPHNEIVIQ